jgi:exoribonuclease R
MTTNKTNANILLEEMLGITQYEERPEGIQGILQTKDYLNFVILSDTGNELLRFTGAKLANKCFAGDHVAWDGEKCILELRDEHPPIVGTVELTNKSRYGLTTRGIPIYLFTPYNKSYPQFIVGCSEKDLSRNRIGLIKFDEWTTTFPRGQLQQVLGVSGDFEAEKQALIWQACPWKYPRGTHIPEMKDKVQRRELKGFTFNIDPEGCRDVDDVLTFEKDNNDWRITITISDVAAYIEDGTEVDIYASLIGQTLYDNDGKVLRPMLPHEYSELACSLLPKKLSYGLSLQFIWNGKEITNKEWFESELRVNKSYTYEEFQECDSEFKEPLAAISSYLAKRDVIDSHEWIEQMMLFYNTEAGKLLKEQNIGILRRHTKPNLEKLEKYKTYLPDLTYLAMSSAEYCLAEELETAHYGLETNTYTHASSPIRRYADLVNQRALKLLIRKSKDMFIVPQAMYDMNYKAKLNKNFGRDFEYLSAISSGQNRFSGIIIDKKDKNTELVKIKIYVPKWKRTISTTYKKLSDNLALSRDEKREIDISDFREVEIECAFNLNSRNWKDRVIINIL